MNVPTEVIDHICFHTIDKDWRKEFVRVPDAHGWRQLDPNELHKKGDVTWHNQRGWAEIMPMFEGARVGSCEWFRRTYVRGKSS